MAWDQVTPTFRRSRIRSPGSLSRLARRTATAFLPARRTCLPNADLEPSRVARATRRDRKDAATATAEAVTAAAVLQSPCCRRPRYRTRYPASRFSRRQTTYLTHAQYKNYYFETTDFARIVFSSTVVSETSEHRIKKLST